MTEHQVCISLGSNIEPLANINKAIEMLSYKTVILAISDLWESPPFGMTGQNFINGAVLIKTPFPKDTLKHQILRPIEEALGRVRTENKYSSRPIDLDILTYDNTLIDQELPKRVFLAVPAAQLIPNFVINNQTTLGNIAQSLAKIQPIKKISHTDHLP